MPGIVVRPRARIFHGHDWVYSSEVLKTFGNPASGDIISLKDGRDRSLGSAIYNSKSQIVARRFSRRKQPLDLDFFVRRISQAVAARQKLDALRNPGRLVWSESDGLPGVIIDRYGSHVVLQTLTLGMDLRKGLICDAVRHLFSPASIVERNDVPIRKAEGMELVSGILHGSAPPELEIQVAGLRFQIQPLTGQKTGFYLDQCENYCEVARLSHGLDVLDCFSNQGAFGLACARSGAKSVTAVEINGDLVRAIEENARRNNVHLTAIAANVFDYLTSLLEREARFDLVILDPPSFAKTKDALGSAWRGYKEIHLRALQLLSPEGILVTFSCSHHVSRAMFLEMIVQASVDAKRLLRILKCLSQPLDHPILPHLPETEYLKGFILQALPGR
ncbi:MAG: class I SAM-dependent rRNA methyltransferase [Chthoniobacterales bacterium]